MMKDLVFSLLRRGTKKKKKSLFLLPLSSNIPEVLASTLGQEKEVFLFFFFNQKDCNKRSKNVFAENPEKSTLKLVEFFLKS